MTVDDYGPMLFHDIDYLAYKASQHAFQSTQRLYPRGIPRIGELGGFFAEREDMEIEARLSDRSESETVAPEENSSSPIKSCDIGDDLGSSIMLYVGLRQCGGVTQRNRGRVAHDHWLTKDEELTQSYREALRTAFLADRAAAKEAVLVEEQVVGTIEEPVEETTET